MRPHRMTKRKSTIALPGVALILSSLAILVMGGEPPRVAHRDREVLEAALKDMLNPKNPVYAKYEHHYRPWPRTIVLHRLTGEFFHADKLKHYKMISKELASAWDRRNSGEPIPLEKLGLQDKTFIITDLDKIEGAGSLFAEQFREKYPDSWGYAYLSLPGYSRGGTAAVVMFECGPSFHGETWVFLLTRVEGRWTVGWRDRHLWE